jgi:hypothetical protein
MAAPSQGYRKNRWTAHTVIPAKAGTQANGLVLAWAPASARVTKGAIGPRGRRVTADPYFLR